MIDSTRTRFLLHGDLPCTTAHAIFNFRALTTSHLSLAVGFYDALQTLMCASQHRAIPHIRRWALRQRRRCSDFLSIHIETVREFGSVFRITLMTRISGELNACFCQRN